MARVQREMIGEGMEMRVVPLKDGSKVELALGGKAVSWLYINDLQMRIGRGVVRMGGIGGVGTDKAHRKKGYSRLCMEKAVETMDKQGYDVTALFGIPDYYTKWGYASVMPEPRLRIGLESVKEAGEGDGGRIAPFDKRQHGREVLAIYAANNRLRDTSLLRPPLKRWRAFRLGSNWGIRATAFVVRGKGGKLSGYAAHDLQGKEEEFKVTEVGYRDASAFAPLCAELARRAKREGRETLVFHLPLDHPFAAYLHRWSGNHQLVYFRAAEGMARIIHLDKTLRKCRGELARRLAASPLRAASFKLALDTDIGSAAIISKRGKLSIGSGPVKGGPRVTMTQDVLTQLLLGYRDAEEAACRCGVNIPRRAMPMVKALFPRGWAYIWQADRF